MLWLAPQVLDNLACFAVLAAIKLYWRSTRCAGNDNQQSASHRMSEKRSGQRDMRSKMLRPNSDLLQSVALMARYPVA
jgi:hypothetical protein